MTQAPVCDGCLLLNRCAYPYMFETPPPHMPEALRKRFHQAPRPYVFQVPSVYRGEPTLSLGLVLVGRAIDYLPYIMYSGSRRLLKSLKIKGLFFMLSQTQYCGHILGCLLINDAVIAKGFVLWTGFVQTLPIG